MRAFTFLILMISFVFGNNCLNAQADYKESIPIKIENVSEDDLEEFSPTISADGKTLIFQRGHDDDKWELFQSSRNPDGTWDKPKPISVINDYCDFIAGPNLSYDGNTLYYTAFIDGESQTEDIYYSNRQGNRWSRPIRMGRPINTDEGYEGFPSISSDGRQLYFISINPDYEYDKKNKENCFTIFVSNKTIGGRWSEPEPLPALINTGCVRDPKIMADNRTLLYSKINIGEKGKFSLYQSQLQLDKSWGAPVSLDFVNDEQNNLSPAIPAAGDTMYYYSQGDLYNTYIPPEFRQFFNATVQGYIRDHKTNKPLAAEIIIRDSKDLSEINRITPNRSDGRYSLILNGGRNYKVEFKMNGYLSEFLNYDLYYHQGYLEDWIEIKLKSEAEVGILVLDKDLNKAIPADIVISDGSGAITSSFRIDNYQDEPKSLSLDINKQYEIKASATDYQSDSMQVSTQSTDNVSARFLLQPLKVTYEFNVRDISTKKKIRTRMTLKNQDEDEIINGYSDEKFQLRLGDQYEVLASGDRGYLFASTMITATEEGARQAAAGNLSMDIAAIAIDASLILNNITFASNSADLSPNSLLELDRVIEFMNLNPGVEIEVSAHSDDVGADAYNLQLSQRRASSVKDHLVKSEIQNTRIASVGYGETRPIAPNDTDENRARNRRVELKITAIN